MASAGYSSSSNAV
uniref:Uncharacterized protein n=1 Tax=Arundo donax TaxID=35708 RepID=A0A0A9BYC6_ARUDO